MAALLDYRSTATPAPNFCARIAAATSLFLMVWYVGGALKLLNAFYSGPGNSLNPSAHRTWWYFIYGVGTVAALAGVVLALCGMRKSPGKVLAVFALIANGIGLFVYGQALPYPN